METIVYGKTLFSANRKLEEIIGEMKFKDVESFKMSSFGYSAVLWNGDKYFAKTPQRGLRSDKAIVDVKIDTDIIRSVILPSLMIDENIEFFNT